MNSDKLFAEAAERGLNLGRLCQYPYVVGSKRKNDHWEAHFHDTTGRWVAGSGRTAAEALSKALYPASGSSFDLDSLD